MKNARILALLAQGIQPTQVLTIVGCTPQFLKALLLDEDFAKELAEEQQKYYAEADEEEVISNKYLSLEHKILKQIESQIPNAELRDTLKALEVVSNRHLQSQKHKAQVNTSSNTINYNLVNLNLPMHAIPEYTLNSAREVIAVDNRAMAPMTGMAVKQLFKDLQQPQTLAAI